MSQSSQLTILVTAVVAGALTAVAVTVALERLADRAASRGPVYRWFRQRGWLAFLRAFTR